MTDVGPLSLRGSELSDGAAPETSHRRYRASAALHARACAVIPGGHHLSGRPLLGTDDSPLYFDRGRGSRIWDVDGNEYVDFVMAYGPFLLGYANERVEAAAAEQARAGNLLSLNHPLHVAFAERLLQNFPAADMAIALKTGSEATTAALRIARKRTGRRGVLRSGYHGWHDWCLPEEEFVPEALARQIHAFDPNVPGSLADGFERNRGTIAAVIVAPEMIRAPTEAALSGLASVAHAHGAVFILDEVKTAFRTPPGSIHQRYGIRPDLVTLSKALGNGHPIAAVIGVREVMQAAEGLHLSATYHGETSAMAAAMTTLDILRETDVAGHVYRMGERLIDGLNESARRHGIPALAFGEPLPPMPFLRFDSNDPRLDEDLRATFFAETYRRGVLLHPRHLWFVSHAHESDDIDLALAASDAAFAVVRERHGRRLDALEKTAPRASAPRAAASME